MTSVGGPSGAGGTDPSIDFTVQGQPEKPDKEKKTDAKQPLTLENSECYIRTGKGDKPLQVIFKTWIVETKKEKDGSITQTGKKIPMIYRANAQAWIGKCRSKEQALKQFEEFCTNVIQKIDLKIHMATQGCLFSWNKEEGMSVKSGSFGIGNIFTGGKGLDELQGGPSILTGLKWAMLSKEMFTDLGIGQESLSKEVSEWQEYLAHLSKINDVMEDALKKLDEELGTSKASERDDSAVSSLAAELELEVDRKEDDDLFGQEV